MDTREREDRFEKCRGIGWEEEYRDYRHQWVRNAKEQIVSDYPMLVDIELSSICNLRCPMCYTITDEFKKQVNATRMDWDLFVKIIDEIGGRVPAIRLSLRGEATLHQRFVEAVRYAKLKGIREISMLTHGGKLTKEFFIEIAEAGMDWITVSADGVGEVYNSIRKPLRFEDLLNKLKDIKRVKEERGWHRPVIKIQGIWPAIRDNPDEFYNVFADVSDLVAFNPLIDYLGKDRDVHYMSDFTCPQQYQRLVIGADGRVMKCSNDEENKEVIGDIKEQSVHDVWHGEKMSKVREMHLRTQGFKESDVCRRCYLPRLTTEEVATVNGRSFTVRNYVDRPQVIGG